jgi:hypothetical protein
MRVSPPTCPTSYRINIRAWVSRRPFIFRAGDSLYPNRGRQSGGVEPREHEIKLGIILIGKIFFEDYIRTHSSKI